MWTYVRKESLLREVNNNHDMNCLISSNFRITSNEEETDLHRPPGTETTYLIQHKESKMTRLLVLVLPLLVLGCFAPAVVLAGGKKKGSKRKGRKGRMMKGSGGIAWGEMDHADQASKFIISCGLG